MSFKPEFIVFAPAYDPDSGGIICLHKLCHILNQSGVNAKLIPFFNCQDISPFDDLIESIGKLDLIKKRIIRSPYKTNPEFNTPIYADFIEDIRNRDDLIVIYPEIIFGNPLRAKHVTRWLLNEPGVISKNTYFVPGEIHFRYLEMHRAISMPWIEIVDQLLTVSHIPWEQYQPNAGNPPREGTAHLVRKGRHKRAVHDLSNSIQIDGKSHEEIGQIFRRVKTFISYDTKSMYSSLAALAGAESIVIPDDGVDEETWQPDPDLRVGIAYGYEKLEWALSTRHRVAEQLKKIEHNSENSVKAFVDFWIKRLELGSSKG